MLSILSLREHAGITTLLRRRTTFIILAFSIVFIYYTIFSIPRARVLASFRINADSFKLSKSPWAQRKQHFPVTSFQKLPSGQPLSLPKVQHDFPPETSAARELRESRLAAVKDGFAHAWQGYKKHAWLKDEVRPLSGTFRDSFGHWAATLVDSLDSLWIMGFREEFDDAVAAVAEIDFDTSTADTLSLFETTIRYLGGLLSAYDLSQNAVLLQKALHLGEMLYTAFDTPNRMPVPYWDWKNARDDGSQEPSAHAVSADVGSLTLEFTRLSQLSGDPKYFDAVQRISDIFSKQQNETALPGLWPVFVNCVNEDFNYGNQFSLGALADSLYEYLPKMYILSGGLLPDYGRMYEAFVQAAKKHVFFRAMNPENRKLLIPGNVNVWGGQIDLDPAAQHLGCFVGGMIGIGAKVFGGEQDLEIAKQLTEGCIWAYESLPSGIMPEIMHATPCPATGDCAWDSRVWHQAVLARGGLSANITAQEIISRRNLPPGITQISDSKYILRPEAIESVFIMYRITGDTRWQDKAWKMFKAIENATRTDIAHAALQDVSLKKPVQVDSMESFWTAETLKYFYLVFSEPELVSLDEFVFNTEAHPFLRPTARKRWWSR
ncbi:MAG: hypothetical protein LQ340_002362 [Diploschistes diacapsis]|nr:MAG: hypothetical protein LQ340_002362 [Diploschistes diacapsis]